MLCGGSDGDPETGARATVAAGLKMIEAIAEENQKHPGPPLALRVGIHTGELVAGVIGKRKFSYDLWGDAVNTASRLESSGEASRIQISQATALLLGNEYSFGAERRITLKGLGEFPVHFIQAKASLSEISSVE